jgi:hypothetical protein
LFEAIQVIDSFLGPVLQAVLENRRFEKEWPPGGPWISLEQTRLEMSG